MYTFNELVAFEMEVGTARTQLKHAIAERYSVGAVVYVILSTAQGIPSRAVVEGVDHWEVGYVRVRLLDTKHNKSASVHYSNVTSRS